MAVDKVLKNLHENYDSRFKKLLSAVADYTIAAELPILKEAYNFSIEAHKTHINIKMATLTLMEFLIIANGRGYAPYRFNSKINCICLKGKREGE